MKNIKILSIIFFTFLGIFHSYAQGSKPREEAINAGIELRIKGTKGTNGSAVAWNPDKQLYYAVIAGNEEYPLETFNSDGKFLYTAEAGADLRGLWYNPKTKTLEGNGYNDYGLFKGHLTIDGYAVDVKSCKKEGRFQPSENSCGAYDSKKNLLYFLDGTYLAAYSASNGKIMSSTPISGLEDGFYLEDDANKTSLIYTGVKGYEIGILDYNENRILLLNKKGKQTAIVNLPYEAVTNYAFWTAYANDKLWLYDSDTRTWTSYILFE